MKTRKLCICKVVETDWPLKQIEEWEGDSEGDWSVLRLTIEKYKEGGDTSCCKDCC